MLISPCKLKKLGVLGMNRRNAEFIQKYNPRSLYPLADDKILTKLRAQEAGLSVPELYTTFTSVGELKHIGDKLSGHSDFVIKPAHGSGGEGVLVIAESNKSSFRKANGTDVELKDLKHHCAHIIHGLYSLGGQPDKAIVEYRVQFAPIFQDLTVGGVPDVRIIVFLGVPVMAMLRLPTHESSGRANLHQGAIGTGIDISTGITRGGVQGSCRVDSHPDTGAPVMGLNIPHWKQMLEIASTCYDMTGLGYLGVDLVLDEERGPLMLEVNARPGLAVQIANMTPLLPRLLQVENHSKDLTSVDIRLKFSMENWG